MTDTQKLLQLAARCRQLAGRCSTMTIARKLEALALDYEEHAHRMSQGGARGVEHDEAPDVLPVPSGRPRAAPSASAA